MALKEFHEKDTPENRVHVLRSIMRQRLEEGGDVEAHVNKMNELFQKLLALGDDIKPDFFMSATLLGSLPESYDGLITALEARSEVEFTSTLVRLKVIAEFRRRKDRSLANDETAMKVSSQWVNNKGKSGGTGGKSCLCYFCNDPNHKRRKFQKYWDCKNKQRSNPKRANEKANMVDNDSDGEFHFSTSKVDGFILDSGASCHVVGSKRYFINFNPDHRETINVANGEKLTAIGKGTIQVEFLNASNDRTVVKMLDVLYAPEIGGNLVSVKKLAEKGLNVMFSRGHCEIKGKNGLRQIAVGDIGNSGLYRLREPNKVYFLQADHSKSRVHRRHEILGHRDINVVKTLGVSDLVDGVSIADCDENCKKVLNCEICLQGNVTRIKFPKKAEDRAKNVLDLVHSDVCGPMQMQTPSAKRYILTFIDDFSRFTTVYLLRHKSEVEDNLKNLSRCQRIFSTEKSKYNVEENTLGMNSPNIWQKKVF